MNINGNEVKIDQHFLSEFFWKGAIQSSLSANLGAYTWLATGSAVAFQKVADAHHVLLDPEKRKAFDEGTTSWWYELTIYHHGYEVLLPSSYSYNI